MDKISINSANRFVEEADIPQTRGAARGGTIAAVFDAAKTQSFVSGTNIISFMTGVTEKRRQAIVDSSLLAQLVAKKKVPDATRVYEWYDAYLDVLMNIGWVLQERNFASYKETDKNFETHKAILAVAATLLGAAPTALAIVTSAVNALQSMNANSPWITIFNRESQVARTAHFQISLASQEENGQFMVTLMAFGLEATSNITQVLFFKARSSEATLQHLSGKVTINTAVLDGVTDAMTKKLVGQANDFVSGLPDLT